MSECLDKHTERLDMVERHVSDIEDDQVTAVASQKQTEKVLVTLQAQAEDLEACSLRNNLWIVGLAESTNITNMERFVEQLLHRPPWL